MSLEDTMLSEAMQVQKADFAWSLLYAEFKELISQKSRIEWWWPEAGESSGREDGKRVVKKALFFLKFLGSCILVAYTFLFMDELYYHWE
jgi:hypothetical protein